MSNVSKQVRSVFSSMGLKYDSGHDVAPTFSTQPPKKEWQAVMFESGSGLAIYHLITNEKSISMLRPFIGKISADHYVIMASLTDHDCLFIRNFQKNSKAKYHTFSFRKDSDYEKAKAMFRKYNITSDILTAHAGLASIVRDMVSSSASFTNRGLFSTYYLEERMLKDMLHQKRNLEREAGPVLEVLRNSTDSHKVKHILEALGYDVEEQDGRYALLTGGSSVSIAVATERTELDVKYGDTIPSMQAVAELGNHEWVMLTNGRIWRMYSSKVSSASTNYFEVDLDMVDDAKDDRIKYFVAIFGAKSLQVKDKTSHIEMIHEGSVTYASELEEDMRDKIFNGEMFVMLVRGVLNHDINRTYNHAELESAKKKAIRILYRLLFILYAESRYLLPVDHPSYKKVSLLSMRDGLESFQNDGESCSCWDNLKILFSGISNGDPGLNLPQYSGKLFEKSDIDRLDIRNQFLVPVIRSMTERCGKGVDYQSLGVRHLGSIYEGLLEYDIIQAKEDIILLDGKVVNADFVSGLSKKPESYISKNDIYLSSVLLDRKGTGSYFTPEPIVKSLVKSGLRPILEQRSKKFAEEMKNISKGDSSSEKRCNDIMLDLQVLDPAMGSGHFLVAVADEITRWIMSLINTHPDAPIVKKIEAQRADVIRVQETRGIKLNKDLLTPNSILKRVVMKHCIYGIDTNELSVELAKMSLWLDSFTIGMPLTVLQHHIRHGNSLIGIHDIKGTQKNGSLDDYMETTMMSGGKILAEISQTPDIIPEEIERDEYSMKQFGDNLAGVREKMDIRCANIMLNKDLKMVEARNIAKKHHPFHWKFELPDAFIDQRPGFDLIIGNPPWEAVKPNDDEFFTKYEPNFRNHSNKQDKNKIKTKLLEQPAIKASFIDYTSHIEEQSRFFKESGQYVMRGKGDTDMWKLFLERVMGLLTKGGVLAVVVPSAILTNEGAKDLRKALLNMRIVSIYEFENRRRLFPEVHASYKFVLLTVSNTNPSSGFDAAFYLHHITSLDGKTEQEKFLSMPVELIHLTSPNVLAVPEVRSSKDVDILNYLYKRHKCVRDGLDNGKYTIDMVREFDRTNDSRLFRRDGRGWPLIEGKNFHQFIPDYSQPEFSVSQKKGLEKTNRISLYKNRNNAIHSHPRLTFRNVASSTNIRTMISCIMPPCRFYAHSCSLVVLHNNDKILLGQKYYKNILYLTAVFNSMTFDYLIRIKTNINLSFFIIKGVAIPDDIHSEIVQNIIKISGMLTMQDENFKDMARTLQQKTKKITLNDRINITAKLDALVAHCYGLDKQQYEHILSTFNPKKPIINLDETTEWNDHIIHTFNSIVKKNALQFYSEISTQ